MHIIFFAISIVLFVIMIFAYACKASEERNKRRQQAVVHLVERAMDDQLAMATQSMERFSAENEMRIISESLEIIKSTKNIDIAMQRAKLVRDAAKRLLQFHRNGTIVAHDNFLKYADMTQSEYAEFIQDVITQAYQNAASAALMLKTEKGRLNRMKSFFAKLHEQSDMVPDTLYPWIDKKMLDCGIDYSFDSIVDKKPDPTDK